MKVCGSPLLKVRNGSLGKLSTNASIPDRHASGEAESLTEASLMGVILDDSHRDVSASSAPSGQTQNVEASSSSMDPSQGPIEVLPWEGGPQPADSPAKTQGGSIP